MTGYYGEPPVDLGPLALPEWQEFMHYLYLPVRLPEHEAPAADGDVILPARLEFLRGAVYRTIADVDSTTDGHLDDPYVYVTARRGYATPGNPLNRPGWHCDDFGGTDLNYVWADAYPTRFLTSRLPLTLSDDDTESMRDMADLADRAQVEHDVATMGEPTLAIEEPPVGHLLRLSPHVIHDTPVIPQPGGMRSFVKISVSDHRFDLIGNSHNHLLDYAWPMHDRVAVRNQPGSAQADHTPQETP